MRNARLLAAVATTACAISAVQAQEVATPPVQPASKVPQAAPDPRGVEVLPDEKTVSPSLSVVAGAAGRVFEGVLVRKTTSTPPGMRVLVTEYEFQPHEWFKGARTPKVIVRETGGEEADGTGMYASNSHKLTQGGRYLLFLDTKSDEVLFPFMRILQVFDTGATVADESGRIIIGLRDGAPVTRLDPEVPSLNYLGTPPPRQQHNLVGPPVGPSTPPLPQPQPSLTPDQGPIPAEQIFKLLRPDGAMPPIDAQPAGLTSSLLGGADWNYCGYISGSINFASFIPDNNNWAWYNDAAGDWDTEVNFSGAGGWIFGFLTSGGNPIRNENPVANNSRNNAAVPSDTQMINGGYGSWAANMNPNGICFVWYSNGGCTRIRESDVFTNPTNQFNALQFRKSVVHEMGHAIGFGHEDRWLADMVSGTWRLVPNYNSNFYLRTDDLSGGRAMLTAANGQGAGWSIAGFRDISTFAQTHPNPGTSADVGPYVTTLSTFFANTNDTIQIQHLHVENRGNLPYFSAVTFRVYFSTDTNITTGDYLVYSGGWPNYGGEAVSNNFSLNLTIPPAIPSGNYYVGWIVSSGETQLTSSNDTALMVRDSGGSFAPRTIAVSNTVPANNNCSSAFNVGTGTYFGSTVSATNDGSTNCGNFGAATPDVWYSFTAPCTGTLIANTCGSNYDTVLSVHSGCPATPTNTVMCDDDGGVCGAQPYRQSALSTAVTAGNTYYIRVCGYNGATGAFQLNLGFTAAIPSNDLCSNAIAIGNGTTNGSTICASTDGDSFCGTSTLSPDVWYTYTAVLPGTLHLDTCNSGYDTVISVHTGCPGTPENSLGCDDDGCSYPFSSLEVPVAAGQPYYIRVSGWNGSYGNFSLHTSFAPINDSCSNPLAISVGSTPFTNIGATTDGPTEPNCSFCCGDPQVNNDVWFLYSATCTGAATISMCDATYDTKVAIYQGAEYPASAGTAIACNDDSCGVSGWRSQVTWNVSAGTSYLIRVGGYLGATGSGTIVLSCAPSAACYANCDQSTTPPILNVNDFTCFLNAYAAGLPYANCDASSTPPVLNVNDFTCFLNKYAAGCP